MRMLNAIHYCKINYAFITFFDAGLKYQDTTVRTSSNVGPNSSLQGSLTAICEYTAPDMEKKKPA